MSETLLSKALIAVCLEDAALTLMESLNEELTGKVIHLTADGSRFVEVSVRKTNAA